MVSKTATREEKKENKKEPSAVPFLTKHNVESPCRTREMSEKHLHKGRGETKKDRPKKGPR